MTVYLLVLAALLPAIILCTYVYKKDRVEKEPIKLLLLLLVFGMLICFPAAFIESILIGILDMFFLPFGVSEADAVTISNIGYIYNFLSCFLCVALVEESLKWIVLRTATFKNLNFNCVFDGMIYAIFVSLGFAALENVFYVLQYGFGNAIMRAILSVPGHMFFSVFMGYYYSMWNLYSKAKNAEQQLKFRGVIPAGVQEFEYGKFKKLSLLVPIIIHGAYNFCCSSGSLLLMLFMIVAMGFLYFYCFKKIKQMSRADNFNITYVMHMLNKKYPGLAIEENAENPSGHTNVV